MATIVVQISGIGVMTALAAGAISFLSPCVLPIVPGYLSSMVGRAVVNNEGGVSLGQRLEALGLSLCFVLGFSTVFVIFGASATVLGSFLLSYRYEMNIVGGSVLLAFGSMVTGFARLPWLQQEKRFHPAARDAGPSTAYLLGLAFGFGWTPCIGPVLGAILTMSAASATVREGVILLAVYALGLGLPFLVVAGFANEAAARLRFLRRPGRVLQVASGMIIILLGLAMISGNITRLNSWFLETFPALARIG